MSPLAIQLLMSLLRLLSQMIPGHGSRLNPKPWSAPSHPITSPGPWLVLVAGKRGAPLVSLLTITSSWKTNIASSTLMFSLRWQPHPSHLLHLPYRPVDPTAPRIIGYLHHPYLSTPLASGLAARYRTLHQRRGGLLPASLSTLLHPLHHSG